MKAYVIPIEKACNAKCPFCITNYKNDIDFGTTLDIENLHKLEALDLDKIEITGGGEPFLHPKIDEIINFCAKKTSTQIYTNGSMLSKCKVFDKLSYLCISRAHYDDKKNEEIMGIKMDMPFEEINAPIKLSLVLCKSGISRIGEVVNYIKWAKGQGVKKVVIRSIFEYDPSSIILSYQKLIGKEQIDMVSKRKMMAILFKKILLDANSPDNDYFIYEGMEVEIEGRTCACEAFYPVLRANGKVYVGWTNKLWIDNE